MVDKLKSSCYIVAAMNVAAVCEAIRDVCFAGGSTGDTSWGETDWHQNCSINQHGISSTIHIFRPEMLNNNQYQLHCEKGFTKITFKRETSSCNYYSDCYGIEQCGNSQLICR